MNAGHFGLALVAVGMLGLVGSAIGMSQVSTADLDRPVLVNNEVKYWAAEDIVVWTDPATNCKYVKSGSQGGFTPRLKPNGLPLCE